MIIFAGPSLPLEVRPKEPAYDWRPPAQAGDLIRLLDDAPRRVLLIDGYFDTRPAVTHKECLALMAAGTTLIGAASMGALRYAELKDFGMIGFGQIAEAFARGNLVGDDEVALVHGDARIGWKATTVAMVDVRATLEQCLADGLIDTTIVAALTQRWHDLHYSDRDWPLMIDTGKDVAPEAVLRNIADRHVRLKQADALAAIEFARTCPPAAAPEFPPRTRWVLQLQEEIRSRPTLP